MKKRIRAMSRLSQTEKIKSLRIAVLIDLRMPAALVPAIFWSKLMVKSLK